MNAADVMWGNPEGKKRTEGEREGSGLLGKRKRKAIQLLLLLLLAKGPKMRAKVSARAADPSSDPVTR